MKKQGFVKNTLDWNGCILYVFLQLYFDQSV